MIAQGDFLKLLACGIKRTKTDILTDFPDTDLLADSGSTERKRQKICILQLEGKQNQTCRREMERVEIGRTQMTAEMSGRPAGKNSVSYPCRKGKKVLDGCGNNSVEYGKQSCGKVSRRKNAEELKKQCRNDFEMLNSEEQKRYE